MAGWGGRGGMGYGWNWRYAWHGPYAGLLLVISHCTCPCAIESLGDGLYAAFIELLKPFSVAWQWGGGGGADSSCGGGTDSDPQKGGGDYNIPVKR